MVILSLLLIQEEQFVSFWLKNVLLYWLSLVSMTPLGWLGHKTSIQTNKQKNQICRSIILCLLHLIFKTPALDSMTAIMNKYLVLQWEVNVLHVMQS